MAIVIDNQVVKGVAGGLGDQLVLKRCRSGRTVLANWPHFAKNRVFSPAQLARQAAFREAAAYATKAQRDPIYIARTVGTGRIPYNLAIGDWLHPPEITGIDLDGWNGQAGQLIRVGAQDDVMVARVTVAIIDTDGVVLEAGEAIQVSPEYWEYTATTPAGSGATVLACAWDLPGHETQMKKGPET